MRLHNKRVLITGGARGIGKAIVQRFLQEGAKVSVLDVREQELAALQEEMSDYASSLHGEVCDLSNLESIPQAVAQAIAPWGGVDVLVNNAGVAVRETFLDISLEHWKRIMDINLNAMFVVSQQVCKWMVVQGTGGSVVNMSSKNGLHGSAMLAHYNASKGGVVLLTESMAVDLAPYSIRVNAVAPGEIITPLGEELGRKQPKQRDFTYQIPLGRFGTVEEAANAFLFLASDEASYVTGSTLVIDGGFLADGSGIKKEGEGTP